MATTSTNSLMQRPMPWPSFNFSCYQVGRQSQQQWLALDDVPHGIICIHSLVDYLFSVVGLGCNMEKMSWVYYLHYVLQQIMLKSPVLAVGILGLHQMLYGSVIHILLLSYLKILSKTSYQVLHQVSFRTNWSSFNYIFIWWVVTATTIPPPAPCIVLYLMIHLWVSQWVWSFGQLHQEENVTFNAYYYLMIHYVGHVVLASESSLHQVWFFIEVQQHNYVFMLGFWRLLQQFTNVLVFYH